MASSNDQYFIPMSQKNTNRLSEMTSNDLKSCTKGAVLSFHNISYKVKMKTGFLLGKKTVEKEILSNMSGIMRPGLNAILGTSGAGKSVLLDILASRKHPKKYSGDVLINEEPHHANFKCHSGYVAQDDVMMGTLTVRENLHFSAAIQLPTTMTNDEKYAKINVIIEELDLGKVADTKVGTEQVHGVSTADRKKTSIAMELVTNPSILFLDEPTSALDSSEAHCLILFLQRTSRQGRTIIFSIRQPRYSIFQMFDSLTLLAAGKLIFHGPAQKAVEHFASAGYYCEPYISPADFFLSVISGVFTAVKSDTEEKDYECEKIEEFSRRAEPVVEKLARFYANSSFCRDTKAQIDQLSEDQKKRISAFKEFTYATSFWHQLKWISWRSIKNFLGDSQTSITETIIIIMEGLLIGAFFSGIKNDCAAIQIRAWMLYVLTTFHCLSYMSIVQLFLGEKKLFVHEYMSGYYRESSYFFGKLLCDLVLRRLLQSFVFTFTLYIIIGLNPAVKAFFIMMLTLWMVACSADSVALAIAVDQRVLLCIITNLLSNYLVFMLRFSFTSLFFGINRSQLLWLQYISIPHYGITCWRQRELPGLWLVNVVSVCAVAATLAPTADHRCTGEELLTNVGIDLSPWGLWKNHVVLTVVIIIFSIISFLKLILFTKHF